MSVTRLPLRAAAVARLTAVVVFVVPPFELTMAVIRTGSPSGRGDRPSVTAAIVRPQASQTPEVTQGPEVSETSVSHLVGPVITIAAKIRGCPELTRKSVRGAGSGIRRPVRG